MQFHECLFSKTTEYNQPAHIPIMPEVRINNFPPLEIISNNRTQGHVFRIKSYNYIAFYHNRNDTFRS